MTKNTAKQDNDQVSAKQVREYLKAHPDFLKEHPELIAILAPPSVDHGGNVVDLQQFMVGRLQDNIKSLQDQFEGLIVAARDNISTQSQVHNAVLGIVRARDLEQLLETLTVDLLTLFDVDVVRLALESPVAELYDTTYPEQNYSGLAFVDPGMVNIAMGTEQDVVLCEDAHQLAPDGLDAVFADCSGLIRSCALLRMRLPATGRDAILAFGVRHEARFHPGQGVELLSFLARIIEHRLDQCLQNSEMDGTI